jgi:hypothetical protein
MTSVYWLKYGALSMTLTVVSLNEARLNRRLGGYRDRLNHVMGANRDAFARLYHSGSFFSQNGLSVARDLLLAHQNLLRVQRLIDRLGQTGDVPAPRQQEEVDAIFKELDRLLDKTGELAERTCNALRENAE